MQNVRLPAFAADHDDRNILCAFNVFQAAQKLDSVHHRHVEIAEDQVQLILCHNVQRIGAIVGLSHFREFNSRLLKAALNDLSHYRRVVNNKRPHTLHRIEAFAYRVNGTPSMDGSAGVEKTLEKAIPSSEE